MQHNSIQNVNANDNMIPVKSETEAVEDIDEHVLQEEEEYRENILDMGKEFLHAIKDDRMSTKRNIEEARVFEHRIEDQNAEAIKEYKKELKNPDLTVEQRMHLHDMINQRAESSQNAHEEANQTVKDGIDHLHKLPKNIGKAVVIGAILFSGFKIIHKLAA